MHGKPFYVRYSTNFYRFFFHPGRESGRIAGTYGRVPNQVRRSFVCEVGLGLVAHCTHARTLCEQHVLRATAVVIFSRCGEGVELIEGRKDSPT